MVAPLVLALQQQQVLLLAASAAPHRRAPSPHPHPTPHPPPAAQLFPKVAGAFRRLVQRAVTPELVAALGALGPQYGPGHEALLATWLGPFVAEHFRAEVASYQQQVRRAGRAGPGRWAGRERRRRAEGWPRGASCAAPAPLRRSSSAWAAVRPRAGLADRPAAGPPPLPRALQVQMMDLRQPHTWYPFARALQRRVIYHAGAWARRALQRCLPPASRLHSAPGCSGARLGGCGRAWPEIPCAPPAVERARAP